MKPEIKILILADNFVAGDLLGGWLQQATQETWATRLRIVTSIADGHELLHEWKPEILLIDIRRDSSYLQLLDLLDGEEQKLLLAVTSWLASGKTFLKLSWPDSRPDGRNYFLTVFFRRPVDLNELKNFLLGFFPPPSEEE